MADHGFWTYAQKDPSKLALVEPDGREWTRGELRRVVQSHRARAARARARQGRRRRRRAAERRRDHRALSRRRAGRHVPRADQLAPDRRPRSRTSCRTPRRRCSSRTSASPTPATKAVAEIGFPKDRCFAVGKIDGFRPFAELSAGQPDTTPGDRAAGAVMNYTSGTTGRPKGVRRALPPIDPDIAATLDAPASSRCSASRPRTTTSTSAARRSITPPCWCSRRRRCTSATPSC